MKSWQNWRWAKWMRKIAAFIKPMQIPLHSAYTCFFLILSLFPLLVLLFALLGTTSLGLEEVLALLSPLVPQALHPLARQLLENAYRGTGGPVLSISAAAALWSASRGMHGVVLGLNAVYGQSGRGYWKNRAISALYTFLFLVVSILTLLLQVCGDTLVDYLRMTTVPWVLVLTRLVDLRFMLMLTVQAGIFTLMYALLPVKRNPLRRSLPGAVMAALGWTAFTRLFSLYTAYFPRYSDLFGSVYAVALGMLWLYFCICILFYGGALNRWLASR